jgi:hypothetical protein
MPMYQGKKVTLVGQPQGNKVKIRHEDGREEEVAKDQVQDTGQTSAT